MASLHLAFDVDADVHPELYALLAGIASPAAREERLRQLASAGLLWELVRTQGYPKAFEVARPEAPAPRRAAPSPAEPMTTVTRLRGAMAPPTPARTAAPPSPSAAPRASAPAAAAASRATPPSPVSAPRAPRGSAKPGEPAVPATAAGASPVGSAAGSAAANPAAKRPDFIDLAIDAAPPAPWDGTERRGVPPVLVEEVDTQDLAPPRPPRRARTRMTDVPTLGEDSVLDPGSSLLTPLDLVPPEMAAYVQSPAPEPEVAVQDVPAEPAVMSAPETTHAEPAPTPVLAAADAISAAASAIVAAAVVGTPAVAEPMGGRAIVRPDARPDARPVPPPPAPVVFDTGLDPLAELPAVAPIAQRPDTKSRLLRMKERGLFRNG